MNHLRDSSADFDVIASIPAGPIPANIDKKWILITSSCALLTIFGFALISSGAVRYKSVQSSVITILLGSVLSILFFWFVNKISY